MQLIHSEYTASEYLEHMNERLESHLSLGRERFCGLTGRKYFYVIHHCEQEWDRKYASPKNAALGYVVESEEGCDVHFMTFRGLLCPSQLLLALVGTFVAGFFALWLANALQHILTPMFWILWLLLNAIMAPLYALFESMTDRSEEGANALISFLYDPKNHF